MLDRIMLPKPFLVDASNRSGRLTSEVPNVSIFPSGDGEPSGCPDPNLLVQSFVLLLQSPHTLKIILHAQHGEGQARTLHHELLE